MVQKESYWLELSHYIVLYPVRAGITDQVIALALASLFLGKYCKKPIWAMSLSLARFRIISANSKVTVFISPSDQKDYAKAN